MCTLNSFSRNHNLHSIYMQLICTCHYNAKQLEQHGIKQNVNKSAAIYHTKSK